MLTALSLLCAAALPTPRPQGLELRGGHSLSPNGRMSEQPATITVDRGRITHVGPADASLPTSPATRVKVAFDRPVYVYPGLHDAHGHLLGLGASLEQVNVVGTSSFAEVIAKVVERARTTPAGEWIQGRGWDQNDWPEQAMPFHGALSEAVPDHPVLLTRVDGHAALANARAMQLAGLDAETEDPSGGEILKTPDGRPTGVLIDRAIGLVGGIVPQPSRVQVERRMLAAQAACLRAGLTCVHDAGIGPSTLKMLRRLHAEGRWHLRVYAMLPAASANQAVPEGPWQTPDGVLTCRAVKGYADGALGSRGAAMLAPYTDRPGWKGLLLTPRKGIAKLAQLCAKHGFQLCVHAIGDAANRTVLDVYQRVKFPNGYDLQGARFRIEHAQIVHPDDLPRFAELGVLPSMQPTHLTSDMPWAGERIGADRIPGAYAWRAYLATGSPLPFGSDFPVESHDPRKGLFAAATTATGPGQPALRADQKLGRAQILRCFTRDAAYAAFMERDLGSVEVGKLGDFTVFDRDLLRCKDAELLTARTLLTVIGGKVVFDGRK